jgi:hypothetical protein
VGPGRLAGRAGAAGSPGPGRGALFTSTSPQANVIEDGQTIYAAVIQYGSDPAEVTFYNAQSQVIATAPVGP